MLKIHEYWYLPIYYTFLLPFRTIHFGDRSNYIIVNILHKKQSMFENMVEV